MVQRRDCRRDRPGRTDRRTQDEDDPGSAPAASGSRCAGDRAVVTPANFCRGQARPGSIATSSCESMPSNGASLPGPDGLETAGCYSRSSPGSGFYSIATSTYGAPGIATRLPEPESSTGRPGELRYGEMSRNTRGTLGARVGDALVFAGMQDRNDRGCSLCRVEEL